MIIILALQGVHYHICGVGNALKFHTKDFFVCMLHWNSTQKVQILLNLYLNSNEGHVGSSPDTEKLWTMLLNTRYANSKNFVESGKKTFRLEPIIIKRAYYKHSNPTIFY
jgi:hypothetical protein